MMGWSDPALNAVQFAGFTTAFTLGCIAICAGAAVATSCADWRRRGAALAWAGVAVLALGAILAGSIATYAFSVVADRNGAQEQSER